MNNTQYNRLLKKLSKAHDIYKTLLSEAEAEFIRRYGDNPSNLDFDSWIDTYHICGGFLSAEEIEEEMPSILAVANFEERGGRK